MENMEEINKTEEIRCTEPHVPETEELLTQRDIHGTLSPSLKKVVPESCPGHEPPSSGIRREETTRYIYAIGSIQARFPNISVEKEFAQAVHEGETKNLTNQEVLYQILNDKKNSYLAREVCWVFTVENIDTYILQPRDSGELTKLIESIKPVKGVDTDVIIGVRGPVAPPHMCNGLQVPLVLCNQIYSFMLDEFVDSIPKPERMEDEAFKAAAKDMFFRIMQLADNVGEMDEHRAVNYLALRYDAVYAHTMEMLAADKFLKSVEVRTSRLSGTRKIMDVIFSYVNRKTDVTEKYFTRVDVSGQWPFLVSKLQPFYER